MLPDDVPFTFDFALEPSAKAIPGSIAYELEDGDLLIEGVGLNFDVDRENEAFENTGLLQKSLDAFVANGGPLCYHHKKDVVLGRVLSAEVVSGKGVKLTARVDSQPESSPIRHLYEQIKKGSITGLSAGGFFRRRNTPAGPRIYDADFVEWSATPTPIGLGTGFSVIAGKALSDAPKDSTLQEADGALGALAAFVSALNGEKALPSGYKAGVAYDLASFLKVMGSLRETATSLRRSGEGLAESDEESAREEALGSLADSVETQLVAWEAKAHKLAAKYGPLPVLESF